MKKVFAMLLVLVLVCSVAGCHRDNRETVLDAIRRSPVAKMELPDGSSTYVDGEIAVIRSFADLELMEAPLEPADNESDWLYRIVFNPSERVKNTDEIVVSFHVKYVQINSEYYLTRDGVAFEDILQWVESKFDYFMK